MLNSRGTISLVEKLEESGLAAAVVAHNDRSSGEVDAEVNVLKNETRRVIITEGHVAQAENGATVAASLLELECHLVLTLLLQKLHGRRIHCLRSLALHRLPFGFLRLLLRHGLQLFCHLYYRYKK